MIQISLSIYLFIHGVAHLVGFVVPWRLTELQEAPYKTNILNGLIDVGDTGIRLVGILWLLTALVFFYSGFTVIAGMPNWKSVTLYSTVFSLALCILGLPESKIGIVANIVIFGFLLINEKYEWLL